MSRLVAYVVSLCTIVLAAFVVPMPLVEFSPGGATSIPPLIRIEEVDTTPIDGDISLLTVRLAQPTFAETVRAWTTPVRDLVWRDAVIPRGVRNVDYFDYQRAEFRRTFEVAVAVGLREAGYEVPAETSPIVAQVLPTGPAADLLKAGDLITAVNGSAVATADELIARASGLELGDTVTLEVDRAGEVMTVDVTAGRVPGLERAGIGISLGTAPVIDLPFPVEMGDTSIGGPSAGMMIAVTVFDLVADEDLARGRSITGTGTIDIEGRVGPIGGIQEKVVAAANAGAEAMLIPASQEAEARSVAPDGLTLLPVATIGEAIAALRGA